MHTVSLLWTYLGSTKTLVNVFESREDAQGEADRSNHFHWVQTIRPVPALGAIPTFMSEV